MEKEIPNITRLHLLVRILGLPFIGGMTNPRERLWINRLIGRTWRVGLVAKRTAQPGRNEVPRVERRTHLLVSQGDQR